jgi:hypothetical protein
MNQALYAHMNNKIKRKKKRMRKKKKKKRWPEFRRQNQQDWAVLEL